MSLDFTPGKPIKNTNFQQFRPLGIGGQLVVEEWSLLYGLLSHRVSKECAALLLEPVIDRQRGEIDWYLPSNTPAPPTAELSRQQLLQQAHQLINAGRNLAQQMSQSSDANEKQKGEMLQLALTFPNEDSIIATPYGPAIIGWGHASSLTNEGHTLVTGRGSDRLAPALMNILPPPDLLQNQEAKQFGGLQAWLWIGSIILLLLMLILPWWVGLIPLNFCQHYWVVPLILWIVMLILLGVALLSSRFSRRLPVNI